MIQALEARANHLDLEAEVSLCGLCGEISTNSDGTHPLVVSLFLLGGTTVHIYPEEVEKI